jgi:hypothetical protein
LYAALPLLHQRARVGDHLAGSLAAAMRFMRLWSAKCQERARGRHFQRRHAQT